MRKAAQCKRGSAAPGSMRRHTRRACSLLFASALLSLNLFCLCFATLSYADWITAVRDSEKVFSLAIDPTNTQVVYACIWHRGVFKTTNGGASWKAGNEGLATPNVTGLAVDPTNTKIVYAGTTNSGVFKTTNGGMSWKPVNVGLTSTHIGSLAIDPTNTQVLYAGSEDAGVFKTTNGGVGSASEGHDTNGDRGELEK